MRSFVVSLLLLLGATRALATIVPGDVAPTFVRKDVNGVDYSLADYTGKVVLLAFIGWG